jgi:spermidine synthase
MNLISLCFFITGATALALEVLWSKHLSYFLGNSLYATSTVVSSYMLGLGLGSWLLSRGGFKKSHPFRFYGAIQMLVGIYGALSLLIFSSTEGLLSWIYLQVHDTPSIFLALRFLVFFILITAPVTLMGLTLPLLTDALKNKNYEQQGGLLYALNTWGAVLGSLIVAYLMIPQLGLAKTSYALGAADFLIGLGIYLKYRNEKVIVEKIAMPPESSSFWRFHLFIFALGFLNIIGEVAWYRYLINIFGGSVYAFTNVLAVYLTGIALGSYLGSRSWFKNISNGRMFLALNLTSLGFLGLFTLYFYNHLPYIYLHLFTALDGNHSALGILSAQLLSAAIIILPVTLPMGLLFPALLRIYRERQDGADTRRGVGRVYAFNTLGNVFGSISAGFFIVPTFGFFNALKFVALFSTLLGFSLTFTDPSKDPKTKKILFLQIILLAVMLLRLPSMDLLLLNQGFFNLVANPSGAKAAATASENTSLVFYEEGVNVSVAVLGNEFGDGGLGLRVSSKGEAHTSPQGRRHLLLLGQLPMLFAAHPENIAVIGFGGGMTSHSVLTHANAKSMDILEFEPGVIHASAYFDLINEKPLADPRTHLILEDGRIHLNYTDKKYDVITTDPISPWVAGSANLYSVDFYKLARNRLNDQGVVCQWVQLGDFSEDSFKTMLNSMRKVFPHVSLFIYSDDAVLLGSDKPLQTDWNTFRTRFESPEVARDFRENEIHSPLEVINYFYGDTESIDAYLGKFPGYSDNDNVYLEYTLPFELYFKKGNLGKQIATQFINGRHARLVKIVAGVPQKELMQTELTHFVDEFTDIPENVLTDILMDSILSPKEKAALETQYTSRQTIADKTKIYGDYWLNLQKAISDQNIPRQIEILNDIRKYPFAKGFVTATLHLIYIYVDQGNADLAQPLINETKKIGPALKELYELEIKLREKKGDHAGATQVAKQALKYLPDNQHLHQLTQ